MTTPTPGPRSPRVQRKVELGHLLQEESPIRPAVPSVQWIAEEKRVRRRINWTSLGNIAGKVCTAIFGTLIVVLLASLLMKAILYIWLGTW